METKEQLLTVAVNAAIVAGGKIMEVYTDPAQDFGIELKADSSPLTRADRSADAAIAAALITATIRGIKLFRRTPSPK